MTDTSDLNRSVKITNVENNEEPPEEMDILRNEQGDNGVKVQAGCWKPLSHSHTENAVLNLSEVQELDSQMEDQEGAPDQLSSSHATVNHNGGSSSYVDASDDKKDEGTSAVVQRNHTAEEKADEQCLEEKSEPSIDPNDTAGELTAKKDTQQLENDLNGSAEMFDDDKDKAVDATRSEETAAKVGHSADESKADTENDDRSSNAEKSVRRLRTKNRVSKSDEDAAVLSSAKSETEAENGESLEPTSDETPNKRTPRQRRRSGQQAPVEVSTRSLRTRQKKPSEKEAESSEPEQAEIVTTKEVSKQANDLSEKTEEEASPKKRGRKKRESASNAVETTKTPTPTASAAKTPRSKAGAKRSHKKKQPQSDPYDFDAEESDTEKPVMRYLTVARATFGEMKFSKTPRSENEERPSATVKTTKYLYTSKSAELRRRQGVTSSTATTKKAWDSTSDSSKYSSPAKYTSSISYGPVRYLDKPENVISKESVDTVKNHQTPTRKPTSFSKRGDVSLFSDVTSAMDDGSESTPAQQFGGGTKKRKSRASSVKKERPEASTSEDTPTAPPSTKKPRKKQEKTPETDPESAATKVQQKVVYNLPKNAEEQHKADFHDEGPTLLTGARVLARWPDKNFYVGIVLQRDGLGRYSVQYIQDNVVRSMPAPDILPITSLNPGNKLMIRVELEDGDEELQPVVIQECPDTSNSEAWFLGQYSVQNQVTEHIESVHWERFIIDKEQVADYMKLLSKSTTAQEINAENIEPKTGERPRRSRTSIAPTVLNTPPVAVATPRRRRKPTDESPQSSSNKSKVKRLRKLAPEPAQEDVEEVSADSIPPEPIFESMKFVLTSANRRAMPDTQEERPSIPFFKKQVRQMIEERQGTVVDDFNSPLPVTDSYLVADTHYRTHKYLSALARAVPCVSHMWIYDSCTQNQLQDYKKYLLPAGVSIQQENISPWHSRCPTLLKDLTVFVYTQNKPSNPAALDFVQIWSPLVYTMGANVLSELPEEGHVDILLTDSSCSEEILAKAENVGAAAVSSEWLIQAIITGKQPDPKSHEKFIYNFVESAASYD